MYGPQKLELPALHPSQADEWSYAKYGDTTQGRGYIPPGRGGSRLGLVHGPA